MPPKLPFVPSPTRRRFVQGITAGGLLLGTPWAGAALSAGRNATELRGPDISLTVA
ncbi:MAG: twin-arginine translocation signal domain-containing protein, partial [Gammaproteobacteria bacterium]|nr:twin-arginine translocation signal domain-containing protein [Gammaproteobacteria bacterium]